MPEIPLKISRAIICRKARELRHNNFMGQGESVLCNFAERAPMPNYKGDREPPRRRNLDVKDRDREIEKVKQDFPRLNSYRCFTNCLYFIFFKHLKETFEF